MSNTDKYEIINQTKKELREEFPEIFSINSRQEFLRELTVEYFENAKRYIDIYVDSRLAKYYAPITATMSDNIGELAGALSKAQGMLENVPKDSKGYGYNYSSLAGCIEACKIPLSSNGLAVTHVTVIKDDKQYEVTILVHTSGQWIQSVLPIILPPPPPPGTKNLKTPMQELGSCITYARRYGLSAIVGLAQADDDAAVKVKEDPAKVLSKENPIEVRNALKKQIGQLCIDHEVDIKKFAEFHKLGDMASNKLRESITRFEALLYEFNNFNFSDEEEVDDVQNEDVDDVQTEDDNA